MTEEGTFEFLVASMLCKLSDKCSMYQYSLCTCISCKNQTLYNMLCASGN